MLCFALLVAVVALTYFNQSRHVVPEYADVAGESPVIARVSFARESVGKYHSVGPKGQPAWEISRDPALVAAFGNGNAGVVLVRCDCGLVIRMLGQVIDEQGLVTPSIWHDVPECGYHVHGRFADWDNGRWDTAGKADT